MTTKHQKPSKATAKADAPSRRKFLAGAAAASAAAATLAFPNVSRAQTVTLKFQSTWPAKDIFHEFAADYVKKVNDISGGRLKLDLLTAGAVVPAFQLQDAVHSGALDGGHGVTAYWYGKNKAFSLFGTGPAFGMDANQTLGWFYYGGGNAFYNELLHDVLKLNVVGFLTGPIPRNFGKSGMAAGMGSDPVAGGEPLPNLGIVHQWPGFTTLGGFPVAAFADSVGHQIVDRLGT